MNIQFTQVRLILWPNKRITLFGSGQVGCQVEQQNTDAHNIHLSKTCRLIPYSLKLDIHRAV